MVPYVKWCNLKEKTFNHFKEKYPDMVRLISDIGDDVMLEINTEK